jgi:hypothetical protein
MPVEMRSAVPSALPRSVVLEADRDRLVRWLATVVTVLAAAIAVVAAATASVVLGIN